MQDKKYLEGLLERAKSVAGKLVVSRNLGSLVLDVEGGFKLKAGKARKALETVLSGAEALEFSDCPEAAVAQLHTYVYGSLGFMFGERRPVGLRFSQALNARELDYANGAILYLAIAEQRGLPLRGIALPDAGLTRDRLGADVGGIHEKLAVRWGGEVDYYDVDVESGVLVGGDFYQDGLQIPEEAVRSGAYLRPLDKRGALSHALVRAGEGLVDKPETERKFYALLVALDEHNASAWSRLGVNFHGAGMGFEAQRCFVRVDGLDPTDTDSSQQLNRVRKAVSSAEMQAYKGPRRPSTRA